MSSQDMLNRDLALRIGLAARAMPDMDAKRLFTALVALLGLPLTASKLESLALVALNTACNADGKLSDTQLQNALALLQGGNPESTLDLFVLQPYTEGDLPNSVRVACASTDRIHVDGHFGSCPQFLIYQLSADTVRLIAVRDAELAPELEVPDKNLYRAELLQDCQVLYIASIGGPAAAKVVKSGIHPIKLQGMQHIAQLLAELQTVIAGSPPPWLAKAMGLTSSPRRYFSEEATG